MTIFDNIIKNDLCVGCGVCCVLDDNLKMEWDVNGFYKPIIINENLSVSKITYEVCPFNNEKINEDYINEHYYNSNSSKFDNFVGWYKACYIGSVRNVTDRLNATSGGIITWLINKVLNENIVDNVIAVNATDNRKNMFEFDIITKTSDKEKLKSKYYPTEVSKVIKKIINSEKTYMFVGLPCQIKALRKLQHIDKLRNIKYFISLFCGHQKSKYYVDYLSLHSGIDPSIVSSIDYRIKERNKPANAYSYEVQYKIKNSSKKKINPMSNVFAASWANNLFMNPACEFCDDIVGETADISVGDAWLKEYVHDYKGTSIVVSRNPNVDKLLKDSDLLLNKCSVDKVVESQLGGIRQRRDALGFRIAIYKYLGKKIFYNRLWKSKIKILDKLTQVFRINSRYISNKYGRKLTNKLSLCLFKIKILPPVAIIKILKKLK